MKLIEVETIIQEEFIPAPEIRAAKRLILRGLSESAMNRLKSTKIPFPRWIAVQNALRDIEGRVK